MEVIENLANNDDNYSYQQPQTQSDYPVYDNIPNEYVRTSDTRREQQETKSQEIDLLWQSFKSAQFNSNSPLMHVLGGFLAGVISTVIVFALFGAFAINSDAPKYSEKTEPAIEENIENSEVTAEENIVPQNEKLTEETNKEIPEIVTPKNTKTKKYIIKDGDTVEAIIKHEYGAYTPERAEAIMKANNLSNLDHISIDQELLLPIEK